LTSPHARRHTARIPKSGPRAPALLAAAALSLASTGCRRKQSRLLFARREGQRDVVYLAEPTGSREPVRVLDDLPGTVHSGLTIDEGHAMIAMVRLANGTGGELWRVRVDRNSVRAERRLTAFPVSFLFSASRDGRAVVAYENAADRAPLDVYREGHNPPVVQLADFRYAAGADVSADGRRAVIAGTPHSCTDRSLAHCPIELYGVDLTTDPPTPHIIAASQRASYMPRFVPGSHDDRVLYQTTEFDPSARCVANLNDCWHDLVTRDFGGHETPQPLRSGVVGPAYSPHGTKLAFLSYTEPAAGCERLPCNHQSLYVMTPGRDDARRVATGEVAIFSQRYWSADDRWLVYAAEDRNTRARSLRTVHVDGAPGRSFGDAWAIAWVLE
jgi:hypothetical protein